MFSFFKNEEPNIKKVANNQQSAPLVEGKDFYIENGLYVFTEHYHLKRGYCCGNGCRHCAYKNK